MSAQNENTLITKLLTLVIGLGMSLSLFAEAGTSLFTYGKVKLKNAQGEISDLNRGMHFESGDAIITGINGRAQLQMKDGAIFDLKPNTEFLIEEYNYQASSNTLVAATQKKENKGFYKLVRGGFRAISGLIGKRNKKNYRVKTPVATIGIRGTDYTATFCEASCGANGRGLYLSVAEGGVVLANNAGSLDIDLGQAGFVSNANSAPVSITAAAARASSNQSEDVAETVVPREAVDANGNAISLETGEDLPDVVPPVEPSPTGVPGRVVASIAGDIVSGHGAEANLELGQRGALEGFTNEATVYANGSAWINNQGFDTDTGLYWGRWSNGTASSMNASATQNIDLNNRSAHWVYSTNDITPVLPSTGQASFSLIGNSNPTDNAGNSGVLGSANLSADFNTQTVDADVNLSINNRTWDAEANDVALNGAAATFAGDFDSVEITDDATGNQVDGTGSLEGFFTGDDEGELEGAGLVYNLEDDQGTEVEGAVAFEVISDKD